jgi:hypothetical protein
MTRTGKIAKLPPLLQEELNHQLERGVPGRVLVAWLNDHPAVQAVLREFFEGAPVNEQNLSAWRCGGFADWQTRREFFDQVREVATDAGDFEKVAARMADHAAQLLSAQFAIALNRLPSPRAMAPDCQETSEPAPYDSLSRLKPLVAITRTVVALRRSDHEAARLQLEQAAFVVASDTRSAAESNSHPPAHPVAPASRIPYHAGPGHQGLSSQIKVPNFPATVPAGATSMECAADLHLSPASPIPDHADPEPKAKSSQIKVEKVEPHPASPRSTLHNSRFASPATPFPPRLKLTFPPLATHQFFCPTVNETVA